MDKLRELRAGGGGGVPDARRRETSQPLSSPVRNGLVMRPLEGEAFPPDMSDSADSGEKVKTKLMSMWNNVRYGWTIKVKTNFSYDLPIWLQGVCYHRRNEELTKQLEPLTDADRRLYTMELFKRDFASKIWLTYRREFPQLAGSMFTTDCGWGCMLRSGQMLLAGGLVMHFLGRDWRWFGNQTREQEAFHREIIGWFGDSESSPFSLHRLVQIGQNLGKRAGDWYGPSSVAHIMKDGMDGAPEFHPLLSQVCVYVAQDCTVYKQDVVSLCTKRRRLSSNTADREGSLENWCSVIILIPVRLGGESLNPIYEPCIKGLFTMDHCLGVIGGRPKHSLYFVGFQDDKLIHLDPHFCQEVVDMTPRDFPLESFHCMNPRKMSIARMDPSCTIGFYCRTREDFNKFCTTVTEEMLRQPGPKADYPMFIVSDGSAEDCKLEGTMQNQPERILRVQHLDREGQLRPLGGPQEDFVFL
ncbi:ATG4D [Branchiostoma lanceolatum]|uniref:Cysteine protease n=1 Tax=Branchiostoma lanceolatum TaxID=7740 RepID=A0A8K0E9J2_BRALA|nr:ATG4D [Branchiostoma lanceolatum]